VHVYVSEEDLPSASELLMADEVESAFDDEDDDDHGGGSPVELWLILATVVALAAVLFSRSF
jgi:hypothetical protein